MTKRGSVGRFLSAGGGLLMAASFFLQMGADKGFGPWSPMSVATWVIACAWRSLGGIAGVAFFASFLLLIALPHLFGVLVCLRALLWMDVRPRGLGVIRTGVRVHLILWYCAYAGVSLTGRGEAIFHVLAIVSLTVVALCVPWLARSRSRWTDSRFVRRGQQVGAVLCLIQFGMSAAMIDDIYYGLPLAILAAVFMLVGGFLGGRSEVTAPAATE